MVEFQAGTVWLVGAGPGDPDLLTRKAERLIASATIVFHDALVGPGILALIPDGVRRVYVGKRSGRHACNQKTIGAMMIRAAKAGERVVRLKGGDPSIFGRSGEELDQLRDAAIPVSICPGITAASAAAASAGISLTRRGIARKLTFLTATTESGDMPSLRAVERDATFAIYMGRSAAPRIASELIAAGLAPDTPALVVEDATGADERLLATRLDLLPIAAAALGGTGPMLILVGEAVTLPPSGGALCAAPVPASASDLLMPVPGA